MAEQVRVLNDDFSKVPNNFLNNLHIYGNFYQLKIILWLFYANSDSTESIIENCGIPNKTSYKNNILLSLKEQQIIPDEINKKYVINMDFFRRINLETKKEIKKAYYETFQYTMFPNKFFREDLKNISSLAELKILLLMFRYTTGFHRNEVVFSTDKICKILKMSKPTAVRGIDANLEIGRILRIVSGNSKNGGSVYALSTEQNLKILKKNIEEGVVKEQKKKEVKVLEAPNYDYYYNNTGFFYPEKRRGENSWRKVSDENVTFQHVLDAWIELCYVVKHGQQPQRKMEWIIFNKIIKSLKTREITALQFKRAFGYAMTIAMPENHREPQSIGFHEIQEYIGKIIGI